MRKLTIKEFIAYNNPCFCCGDNISLKVASTSNDGSDTIYLSPLVTPSLIEIDLKITYNSSLKLFIEHKNNKFRTNDGKQFLEYIHNRSLHLNSYCKCQASIFSSSLDFNLGKGIISPLEVDRESYFILNENSIYGVYSDRLHNQTYVTVDRINSPTPVTSAKFELPFIPMQNFKTPAGLVKKIKTYLVFS